MKNNKRNAFTLIELIAVLVIMTIIALIVTPLVMNIIRKVRISADKRSIDAYGRSIELAVAGYLLDNGKFPTTVDQLTIEYSGNEVICSTTQLNPDSSVYLTGCIVEGRSVDYTYGEDKNTTSEPVAPTYTAYSVGDTVTYNSVNYYVIADSSASESTVTLLKAEPLTVAEVNQYGGVGTENNHVNMYVTSDTSKAYYQAAYNDGVCGGMAYYTSETCSYASGIYTGCKTDYSESEIKYVVDAWKTAKAPAATEARLITFNELTSNLGYEYKENIGYRYTESTPNFVYDISCDGYWTMTPYDETSKVWRVGNYDLYHYDISSYIQYGVRPVIVLPKSALATTTSN